MKFLLNHRCKAEKQPLPVNIDGNCLACHLENVAGTQIDIKRLPFDRAGLHLEHNPHKGCYDSAEIWFKDHQHGDPIGEFADITPEDYAECLRTDEIWYIQWYPHTPISFYCIAAPTLEKLFERLAEPDYN